MKHPLIAALLLFCALFASATPVRLINIDDEIGSTAWLHTKRGLQEAVADGAALVVLRLNTYGGTLVHADSMRTALLHCPVPTVAFIDNNAASAGALIAIACDTVYMRPEATMGAATVVNGADGAAMPDKYQSYMRAMMRATAESHGKLPDGRWRRDPLIAEAMVDPTVKVPGLIGPDKVLTFTAGEALRWGYADGTADSVDDLLAKLHVHSPVLTAFAPTWIDNLLGFLTNPAVQGLLIMLIIGGIYFEMQTPGFGVPSVVAIMAAALYFLPLYLTGIASSWLIILFLAGLLLLLLEIFVIPGFGAAGIAGIAAMGAALFIGLLENFSLRPGHIDMTVVMYSILTLLASAACAVGLIFFLTSRMAPRAVTSRAILTHSQDIDKGYIGVDSTLASLAGAEAVAATDLHPGGKIRIDGKLYDAVATAGFIPEGTPVKVERYSSAQLYVTAAGNPSA